VTVLLNLVTIFCIYLDVMRTFDQTLWSTEWKGIKKSVFSHPSVRVHYFLKQCTNFDQSC